MDSNNSNPATPLGQSISNSQPNSNNLTNNEQIPLNRSNGTSPNHYRPSVKEAIDRFFPSIATKSSDELFTLLTVQSDFDEYFSSMPEILNQTVELNEFQSGNEALARDNLTYQAQILTLTQQIESKVASIHQLEHQFQELKREETEILRMYQSKPIVSSLDSKRQELDQQSELEYQNFLTNEIDATQFLSQYRKSRTQYHRYDVRLTALGNSTLQVIDINSKSLP